MTYKLASPDLNWLANGAPHSNQFDDIYFDTAAGLSESEYVFLQHNNLPARWLQHQASSFTIAETGFGTGLNFLCCYRAWLVASPAVDLHFISVEKFPLTRESLQQALAMWPELAALSYELIEQYPVVCKGLHRIVLAGGRVRLTLWFGEAVEGFDALNTEVDAWFLDGFAPSKNPAMWSESLFQQIWRLSGSGTTFSTFTSAGMVRRGLVSVGFDVQKVKGFGHKREMLVGRLVEQSATLTQRMTQGKAWFFNRHCVATRPIKSVLVVGAGLAGCYTANALAQRGVRVVVWDKEQSIAAGASGNAQGMIYPKLSSQDTPSNRFYLAGYLYTHRLLKTIDPHRSIWNDCGLVQQPVNDKERLRFEKMMVENLYPAEVLQYDKTLQMLHLPLAGWVIPKRLCQKLLDHDNIKLVLGAELVQLTPQTLDAVSGKWIACAHNGLVDVFDSVVFCQAYEQSIAERFLPLPKKTIKGQVSQLPVTDEIALLDLPQQVRCADGYVSPPLHADDKTSWMHFGATYDLHDKTTTISQESHLANLNKLNRLLPYKDWQTVLADCRGRVSFRCTVPDYVPIVGPIMSSDDLEQVFCKLRFNAKWRAQSEHVALIDGLYINIGHGSRGLVSTPICAEYLSDLILGQTSVFEREIEHILHPSRFVIRRLLRGQL